MSADYTNIALQKSLLSWERGLKWVLKFQDKPDRIVAPLVGAWIEIPIVGRTEADQGSLLSWERGLKSFKVCAYIFSDIRRSSRGSVD